MAFYKANAKSSPSASGCCLVAKKDETSSAGWTGDGAFFLISQTIKHRQRDTSGSHNGSLAVQTNQLH